MSGLNAVIHSMQARWASRQPRERLLLMTGMGALILIIAYLSLWEPAARGIRQLGVELPMLRTQYAAMQAMAQEVARLRGRPSSAKLPQSEQVTAVRQSLERVGLKASVESAGDGRVRIRIEDTDYAAWAAWLASVENDLGARTAKASLSALSAGNAAAASGHVRVELVLDFSKPVSGASKS